MLLTSTFECKVGSYIHILNEQLKLQNLLKYQDEYDFFFIGQGFGEAKVKKCVNEVKQLGGHMHEHQQISFLPHCAMNAQSSLLGWKLWAPIIDGSMSNGSHVSSCILNFGKVPLIYTSIRLKTLLIMMQSKSQKVQQRAGLKLESFHAK